MHTTRLLAFLALFSLCLLSQVVAKSISVPNRYQKSLGFRSNLNSALSSSWREEIASRDDFVSLTFAMKLRNVKQLENIFHKVSNPLSRDYGKYLSLEEVNQITSPHSTTVQNLIEFLQTNNVQDFKKTTDGDFVVAKMTVGKAQELLLGSAKVAKFTHYRTGKVAFHSDSPVTLPHSIGKHIDFVSGLEGPTTFDSHLLYEDKPNAINVTPSLIKRRYNITRSGQEAKNLQCVVSFLEQYFSHSDLKQFYNQNLLPQHAPEKIIGTNNEGDPGVEASLDVQFLMGVASSVPTWVWYTEGRHEDQEPFIKWLHDVSDSPTVPFVFSISYQDYEDTLTKEWTSRVNTEFMKLGTRGITLVTGSGDWGVGCTSDCQKFRADFPSSSPYIVSTGATFIYRDEQYALQEQAVTFSSGGFSNYFSRPTYQDRDVSKFLQQTDTPTKYFNSTGRGFPDVSAVGQKFQVVYKGKTIPVAGTSASTPTFAAIISLINDMRLERGLPTLGHVNPFLYQAAARSASAFIDITEGSNPYKCCMGFKCTKGWDPMTGLGTPNFGILAELAMSSSVFPSLYSR